MEPTNVVGRRVAAVVIDYVLLFAFNSVVFFLMAKKDTEVAQEVLSGKLDPDATSFGNVQLGDHEYAIVGGDFLIYLLITVAVGVLYWMVLPGLKGWTLGKRWLGLRVVREDGTCPAGVGKNVIRQLVWIVDDFPYLIPALTGFIVALTNDQNRRVGDMAAGTLVVRASAVGQAIPASGPAAAAAAAQPGLAAPAQPVAAPAQPVAAPAQPAATPAQPAAEPVQPVAAPAQPAAAPAQPAAEPVQPVATPAGWYSDPHRQKRLRYWDGERWTEHTAD